jgi:hypothetical protein
MGDATHSTQATRSRSATTPATDAAGHGDRQAKSSIILRLLDHAEHNWPQLTNVQASYHGSFATFPVEVRYPRSKAGKPGRPRVVAVAAWGNRRTVRAGEWYVCVEVRELAYWAVHEARYPSRPGDDAPDGKVYDSMDALLADLSSDG